MNGEKTTILFLCTGNSCRSQMAEGFVNNLKANELRAFSAGVDPQGLNPLAIRAMEEMGIDISNATSKLVDQFLDKDLDYVVTVCDQAKESCPVFLGKAKKMHMGFDDPPALADGIEDQDEAIVHYRRVRDEIRAYVEALPEALDR